MKANNILIACCGLNCEECEARIATVNNDDVLRREVAEKWSEWNNTDLITPDTINCMGCRVEGVKYPFCDGLCQIRQCVASHGFKTCGDCSDFESCPKISPLFDLHPEVKSNLGH